MDKYLDCNMGIDEILELLGSVDDNSYHKLNMILWSLQSKGVITFDEDKLDKLYNEEPI